MAIIHSRQGELSNKVFKNNAYSLQRFDEILKQFRRYFSKKRY